MPSKKFDGKAKKGVAVRRLAKSGQPSTPMRHARDEVVMTRAQTLGERLRTARHARNLTQEELAGGTFSKSYLSAIERGKMTPSIPALRVLAQRLDVSLASLLGEDDHLQDESPAEDPVTHRLDEAEAMLHLEKPAAALEQLGIQHDGAEVRRQNPARWDWLRAWALLQQHQVQEAVALLQQGLQEAEAASQARCAQGHFAFTLATAKASLRQEEEAERAFRLALECAEETDDQALLGSVQEHYGALLAAQGRYQDAYDHLRAALAAAARPEISQVPKRKTEGSRRAGVA